MKEYITPTLRISLFRQDENIIASEAVNPDGSDTPEGTFPQDSAIPLPDDPFGKN